MLSAQRKDASWELFFWNMACFLLLKVSRLFAIGPTFYNLKALSNGGLNLITLIYWFLIAPSLLHANTKTSTTTAPLLAKKVIFCCVFQRRNKLLIGLVLFRKMCNHQVNLKIKTKTGLYCCEDGGRGGYFATGGIFLVQRLDCDCAAYFTAVATSQVPPQDFILIFPSRIFFASYRSLFCIC